MTATASSTAPTRYLTPAQVCELIPGMTPGNLGQLRFKGIGPKFLKPSPRVVVYREDHIQEWLDASIRTGTAEGP